MNRTKIIYLFSFFSRLVNSGKEMTCFRVFWFIISALGVTWLTVVGIKVAVFKMRSRSEIGDEQKDIPTMGR